jgi:hypothetical protein
MPLLLLNCGSHRLKQGAKVLVFLFSFTPGLLPGDLGAMETSEPF